MIRVLVVDDHPLVRAGMIGFIKASDDCELAGEADSYDGAIQAVQETHPDVVLLDIQIKGEKNGVDVARTLKQSFPDVKVLVLSNFQHDMYVRGAIDMGVNGYLLKDTSPGGILNGIRMVADGQMVMAREIGDKLLQPATKLTRRETQIIQLSAEGSSASEIAEQLGIAAKTVQARLGQIYTKLDVDNKTEALAKATSLGLIVIPGADKGALNSPQ